MPVVVQVMNVHFKTARAHALQKSFRNNVALLGNHLERTPDPVAVVKIHQVAAERSAWLMFDVVGHEDATLVLLRPEPEPDEGNALVAVCFDEVFGGKSLAAVVIAAHEAGHAMQDASGYPPLQARTRLAKQAIRAEKVAAVVMLAVPIVMVLAKAPYIAIIEVFVGVMIFALSILLHAVTLPVEFDASFRRALPVLQAGRYLDDKDMPAAKQILRAAAFTYVAAAAMSLLDVARWLRVLRF